MRKSNWTPSIVPSGDDHNIYLVMDDRGKRLGRVWRETDETTADFEAVIFDLLGGQYKSPVRVVAFNIKRDQDAKRLVDKHKAEWERRQQWADKRRYQQRQEQELREVEDKVREETEPRRESAVEPVRIEMPPIRLFGAE